MNLSKNKNKYSDLFISDFVFTRSFLFILLNIDEHAQCTGFSSGKEKAIALQNTRLSFMFC